MIDKVPPLSLRKVIIRFWEDGLDIFNSYQISILRIKKIYEI